MHQRTLTVGLVLLVLSASTVCAQDRPASAPETVTLWHEAKALFPTQVMLPEDFDPEEPHTLVLALHGYASTAEAFRRVAAPFVENGYVVALPEAAYAVLVDGRLGYDWWLYQMPENQAMHFRALQPLVYDHLPAVVNDLRERYRIDAVYVLGFSQGALTAFLLGVYQHALFDGIVGFGGLALAEWYEGDVLAEGRDVRVLIVHGEADAKVAFADGERTRDLFAEHGYDVTFRAFDGGHLVPLDQLDFVADWIRGGTASGR